MLIQRLPGRVAKPIENVRNVNLAVPSCLASIKTTRLTAPCMSWQDPIALQIANNSAEYPSENHYILSK